MGVSLHLFSSMGDYAEGKRARLPLNYFLIWQQTGEGYIYKKEDCALSNNSCNGRHSKLAGSGNSNIQMLYIESCCQKQDPQLPSCRSLICIHMCFKYVIHMVSRFSIHYTSQHYSPYFLYHITKNIMEVLQPIM